MHAGTYILWYYKLSSATSHSELSIRVSRMTAAERGILYFVYNCNYLNQNNMSVLSRFAKS